MNPSAFPCTKFMEGFDWSSCIKMHGARQDGHRPQLVPTNNTLGGVEAMAKRYDRVPTTPSGRHDRRLYYHDENEPQSPTYPPKRKSHMSMKSNLHRESMESFYSTMRPEDFPGDAPFVDSANTTSFTHPTQYVQDATLISDQEARPSSSLTPTSKRTFDADLEQMQVPDTSARRRPFSTQSQMPSRGVVVLHPMQAEPDDYLHIPDKNVDAHSIRPTWRGCVNFCTLFMIAAGLLMLFIGYPLIANFDESYNNVGDRFINNGKSPAIPMPPLIDPDTPPDAHSWTSQYDESEWDLVFSDEFNKDGRTFWPGEDPFWEAGDFYYLATQDYEWYTPEAIRTMNGSLVITMENIVEHTATFRPGMLQSWNKFCIQGGYVETKVILPSEPTTAGYWPGFWMMGNLGRPGYLGTTDGMWPYSYNQCDIGILEYQQYPNRTGPYAATHANSPSNNPNISSLPGMRFPACACSGQEHPGPNAHTARSVPELDIFEMQVKKDDGTYASQSYQIAPFDDDYKWFTNSSSYVIYNHKETNRNSYSGGPTQEALSCVSRVPDSAFFGTDGEGSIMGVEYMPDFSRNGQGYVTWYVDGKKTWTLFETALAPNKKTQIGQRTLPLEPMSLILNLGISKGFQNIDWKNIEFPAHLAFDYVRVYQKRGEPQRISCDPSDYPTADYINKNMDLYSNSNITSFLNSTTRHRTWPKNGLKDGC